MGNTNIQSKVTLKGRGFVRKRKGNYEAGEFKNLVNCRIEEDDIIRERNNIHLMGGGSATQTQFTNPREVIGHMGQETIITTDTKQYVAQYQRVAEAWSPSSLTVPSGGYHRISGAFRYNDTVYWLTEDFDPARAGGFGEHFLYLHHVGVGPLTDIASITYASLTHTQINPTFILWPVNMRNHFIWKDRLWIITDRNIFYSKATDPLDFTTPNGGFFRIPDVYIQFAFPIGDTLYILTDQSVSIFTYSEDINTDGYLRTISTDVGGTYGVDHNGVAYFTDAHSLYAVNGLSVDKIMDLDFDEINSQVARKLVSFGQFIILLRRTPVSWAADWHSWAWRFVKTRSANNYNQFWINSETGAVHVVDFKDCLDITEATTEGDLPEHGYVTDIYNNPNEDVHSQHRLLFLTTRMTNITGGSEAGVGSAYFMNRPARSDEPDFFTYDEAFKSNGTFSRYKARILIEIEAFQPDGNKHLMKKFRSIAVQGKMPNTKFLIAHRIDGAFYGTGQACEDDYSDDPRTTSDDANYPLMPHFNHRFPVNQRGRSISIKLYSDEDNVDIGGAGIWDELELSEIRVYWTYLGRMASYRNHSKIV